MDWSIYLGFLNSMPKGGSPRDRRRWIRGPCCSQKAVMSGSRRPGMPCPHFRFQGTFEAFTLTYSLMALISHIWCFSWAVLAISSNGRSSPRPRQGRSERTNQSNPAQRWVDFFPFLLFLNFQQQQQEAKQHITKTLQVLASPCDQIASRAHLQISLGRNRGGGRGGDGGRVGLVVGRLRRVNPALPVDRRVVGVVEPQRALRLDGRLCVCMLSSDHPTASVLPSTPLPLPSPTHLGPERHHVGLARTSRRRVSIRAVDDALVVHGDVAPP